MVFAALGWFFLLTTGVFCVAQEITATLPYHFTLAAVNATLPNANSTGVPLVLGQDGATSGITFHVTSTYASFPYNDYPYLGLVDGSLRAYTADGWWATNATEVMSGGTLGWITTTLYKAIGPEIFSAVRTAPADQYPMLSTHGFHNLWSLCPFTSRGGRGQTNIVFNVSSGVSRLDGFLNYDPTLCYPVRVNVVPDYVRKGP